MGSLAGLNTGAKICGIVDRFLEKISFTIQNETCPSVGQAGTFDASSARPEHSHHLEESETATKGLPTYPEAITRKPRSPGKLSGMLVNGRVKSTLSERSRQEFHQRIDNWYGTMKPDGVAIFFRDEDEPLEISRGADSEGLARAWDAAVKRLSAQNAHELREQGYFARLVSVAPFSFADDEGDEADLIESCLSRVEVEIERSECTSGYGDGVTTEILSEGRLLSTSVRVPIVPGQSIPPEFEADFVEDLSEGVVELRLSFTLNSLTSTHAVFDVEEAAATPYVSKVGGKMAPSSQLLFEFQANRKHG